MARKSKKQNEQQLSLFDLQNEQQLDIFQSSDSSNSLQDDEEKWSPDENYALEASPNDRQVEPQQPEMIALKLLRRAIAAQNPDDEIMRDFGKYVLPNLLRVAIGVTAKGGK